MQPRRQTNPWLIVLGVCGGCAVLVVIGFVALGAFGVSKAKALTGSSEKFLTSVKSHDYTGAVSLLTPSGQSAMPESELKAKEESMESSYGPLKSWAVRQGSNSSSSTGAGQATATFSYNLQYDHGTAQADFTFSVDQSANFKLEKVDLH